MSKIFFLLFAQFILTKNIFVQFSAFSYFGVRSLPTYLGFKFPMFKFVLETNKSIKSSFPPSLKIDYPLVKAVLLHLYVKIRPLNYIISFFQTGKFTIKKCILLPNVGILDDFIRHHLGPQPMIM